MSEGRAERRSDVSNLDDVAGPRGSDRASWDLLDVALRVVGELDLEPVLAQLLEAARDLTGAQYAALGVLNEDGTRLERFLTVGIDDETRRLIGPLPTGHGVLGELIKHPTPLRLADVGEHPRSYGFPAGHPPMRSFLGVPILIGGQPFGNIYLTEKGDGELFDEQDERALVALAAFAGAGIDHARRFETAEAQRDQLARTVAALDASHQISRALGIETEVDAVLELVAKRGRALVGARALVLEALDGDDLIVAAGAGELPPGTIGQRVPLAGTLAEIALDSLVTQRLDDPVNQARFEEFGLGHRGVPARSGLVIPLILRGERYGALLAIDHLDSDAGYSTDEQRLLEAFAASAASALATAHSVTDALTRQRIAAGEQERARWARELHDETLQGLASTRLMLSAILKMGGWDDPERQEEPIPQAILKVIAQTQADIASLRGLITELRPAALDALGIEGAIQALADRAAQHGVTIDLNINLAYERGRHTERHTDELEAAAYRIVQEAITNARKHGHASHVRVDIEDDDTTVRITVTDDGDGFDPQASHDGFGLLGMRERTNLLGGQLTVHSAPGNGTTVQASMPGQRRS